MLKRLSWIFLLPLVASLLWVSAPASHAAGETWSVTSVDTFGCGESAWRLNTHFAGLDSDPYVAHTTLTSGGLVYMNEDAGVWDILNGDQTWYLNAEDSYGPTTGTYPIPSGQQMRVTFTLERPKGHIIYGWSTIMPSCDTDTLAFNAADFDGDFVSNAIDKCPKLKSSRANGCPLRSRTLTLNDKYSPRRVVGKLYAPGYPLLYAGRTVKIWKKRDGPDLKVATRTTNSLGKFKAQVGKGRYYATAKGLIVASSGQATADKSVTVRVH